MKCAKVVYMYIYMEVTGLFLFCAATDGESGASNVHMSTLLLLPTLSILSYLLS